ASRYFDRRLGRGRHSSRIVERLSSGPAMTRRSKMPGRRLLHFLLAVLAGWLVTAPLQAQIGPDVEHRFLTLGLQPTGTSAAAFADIQKHDSEKWAPAVKASGFRPEE